MLQQQHKRIHIIRDDNEGSNFRMTRLIVEEECEMGLEKTSRTV